MINYTRIASIRPLVLSSSVYRHAGGTVFTVARRTSVTLVSTPDNSRYLFKLGNKQPLFTAENQPNGTVKLTSTRTDFPCWLTIAGADLIRLAQKAKLHIDEIFLTPEELFLTPASPVIDTFKVPALDDDYADLAAAHLSSAHPTPHQVPAQSSQMTRPSSPRGTHPRAPSYTYMSEQFKQDVALLWG